jgi:hypothetical protein
MGTCAISNSNSVQCGAMPQMNMDMAADGSLCGAPKAVNSAASKGGSCGGSSGCNSGISSACDAAKASGTKFLAGLCDSALNVLGCCGGGCSNLMSSLMMGSKKKLEPETESV